MQRENPHREPRPRRAAAVATALAAAFLAAQAPAAAPARDAQAGGTPSLTPRHTTVKPDHAVVPPGRSDDVLVLKLREGTQVRLRGGRFVSRGRDDVGPLNSVLRGVSGLRLERLFSRDEEVLAREKARVEAKSGRRQADKNLYYRVRTGRGVSLPALIDALNALDIVEIAYAAPRPAPPPQTPDFSGMQGYLGPAPDGIDADGDTASEVCGGRGSAVTVLDIEYSWNLAHEDLGSAAGALVANQTPDDPFDDNNHGTAVLGELIAGNNGFGVTGIVHDAGVLVVNASNEEDGYDLADSIDIAHGSLAAGDVMLIEQQIAGPNGCDNGVSGCVAVEWDVDVYDTIVAATSDGIIVVEAAGNGGENLDDSGTYGSPFPDGRADSGAIIVGSGGVDGCVNPERSRRPSSTYGSRVNLQGWGECVTTTGYMTLQGGPVDEWYTASFNGTSSASPIVAGAAASLSSTAQTLTGLPPSPAMVRSILMSTGTPQNTGMGTLSGNIGPLPDLKAALATYETMPPELTCPVGPVAECTSPAGAAVTYSVSASDDCDPTPAITCFPPSGSTFPLGVTPTSCGALDAVDNEGTCDFPVTVEDTTDPEITASPSRDVLWPPNHKLSTIEVTVEVTDVCDPDPTFVLTSITSDEPEDGTGDGDFGPDVVGAELGTPDTEFQLRSERSGLLDGRVYTITYTAMDDSGNTNDVVIEVRVPHDRAGLALASTGFTRAGTAFPRSVETFSLIVPSTPEFDATRIDPADAMVGHHLGVVRPIRNSLADADGDGLIDLELWYPAGPVLDLRMRTWGSDPVGLHYDVGPDAEDYLVPDIFRLVRPVLER